MELKVEKIHANAILPKRAHEWDAGLDLYAAESRVLFCPPTHASPVVGVRTGIKMAIPEGHFGLMAIRSSLGKKGIQLANPPGIIDAGYRGEIICLMTTDNPDLNYYMIKAGERIAQMVIIPIPSVTPVWADSLPNSDGRGTGGFGSTGKL